MGSWINRVLSEVGKLGDSHGPAVALRVMLLHLAEVFLEDSEPHLLLRGAAVSPVGPQLETLKLAAGVQGQADGGQGEEKEAPHRRTDST